MNNVINVSTGYIPLLHVEKFVVGGWWVVGGGGWLRPIVVLSLSLKLNNIKLFDIIDMIPSAFQPIYILPLVR